jgi:PAS domain S-box-containing protein
MDEHQRSDTTPLPTRVLDTLNGTSRALPHGQAAEESLWRHALSAAADAAFVATGDGRIVLWNASAERIMGYQAVEVLDLHSCDLFARHDADRQRSPRRSCRLCAPITTGEPIETFDLETKARGGRQIWLNMSTLVLPVADRQGYQVIRMFRDITATKDLLALIRDRLTGTPSTKDPLGCLTRREVEVLRLMASGATNRILAARLHVSPATVRNHTHHIFEKLGVSNRVAAITYAISQLLI